MRLACPVSFELLGQRLLAATWLARHNKSSRCGRWEEEGAEERAVKQTLQTLRTAITC